MTEAVVHVLEAVEVDEQHRQHPRVAVGTSQGMGHAVGEQRPVGQAGERVAEGLLLVQLPGHHAGHAGRQHEEAVDEGPLEGVVDGRVVVVDGLGVDRPEQAVVEHDEADGEEEREPVLVQGEDAHHHEEVEVHLDHPSAEIHQHGGGGDQAQGAHGRHEAPAAGVGSRQEGEDGYNRGEGGGLYQAVATDQGEAEHGGYVGPQQIRESPVPDPPHVFAQ